MWQAGVYAWTVHQPAHTTSSPHDCADTSLTANMPGPAKALRTNRKNLTAEAGINVFLPGEDLDDTDYK